MTGHRHTGLPLLDRAAVIIILFVDPALDLLGRRTGTRCAPPKVLALPNALKARIVRRRAAVLRCTGEPEHRQMSRPSMGGGCEIVTPRERQNRHRNINESALLVVDTQDGVLEIRIRLRVREL